VQIEIIDGVNGYFDTYPSARITLSPSDFIRNIKGLVPRAANGGSTMGVQNSEMWIGSRDDNAQHYREMAQHHRERAQQIRELALTMASEEDRKDLEWVAASPSYSVRPDGAEHQWRKIPPGELSVRSGS
jgi:hypothetical protein